MYYRVQHAWLIAGRSCCFLRHDFGDVHSVEYEGMLDTVSGFGHV